MESKSIADGARLTWLARAVSILGHPLLLTPAAGAAAWMAEGGGRAQGLWIAVAGILGALLVMGYSYWRVRSGAWAHVDASGRGERRHLNRFLLIVSGIAALAGIVLGWPLEVSLSLSLSAAMVAASMLAARWCKPSLHISFAVFAAGLFYAVSAWAMAAGLSAVLVIAWSRLHLRRHVRADLWCGAGIGAAAATAFWIGLEKLAG